MTWQGNDSLATCPCGWTNRERLIGGPQMSPSLQAKRAAAGRRMDAAIEAHWQAVAASAPARD